MTVSVQKPSSNHESGTPTWEVAHLFPPQGGWTDGDYLTLKGNRLVELSDGVLEVLPMPTQAHQLVVMYLSRILFDFVSAKNLGVVLVAPLPVRLWQDKFRQPDVVFMLQEHAGRRNNEFWDGADLAIEVVSPDDRRRDLEIKRREYARAAIPEYWIVDPQQKTVTVFRLAGAEYTVHSESGIGGVVTSAVLSGLSVDVRGVFAAAED